MRLPDFLIIGAQKAGTTTLFRDLGCHPRVFFSHNKEPDILVDDRVLNDKGRRYYASLFAGAAADQLCAEASTAYTKLPDFPGVPRRAVQVLGNRFKAIYIVRDPVERALSHHYHDMMAGLAPPDVDAAIEQMSCFTDYSRYATQVEPWLDAIGRDRLALVKFERYMEDRRAGAARLHEFLELPALPESIDEQAQFNIAEDKKVIVGGARSPLTRLTHARWYRNRLRPMISDRLVHRIRRAVSKRPPARPGVRRIQTIDRLIEALAPEIERLAGFFGESAPVWDLHATRAKYDRLVRDEQSA